jgi:hypothetical protein
MTAENGGDASASTETNSAAKNISGASQTSRDIKEHPSTSRNESWRQVVGRGMHYVSDVINENILAARYATIASVILLTAYGVASTPLFYRFKAVKDIPSSYFLHRRTIHGRLVRVVNERGTDKGGDVEKPLLCLVRHLSPAGRFLSRSAFEFFMKTHPAAGEGRSDDDLLRIEIAAVREPPQYMSPEYDEQPGEWLRRLADQKAPVACKLLSRQARIDRMPKRQTSALAEFNRPASEEQTAVCQIRYRAGGSIFRVDLAESLVRQGRVEISSGMFVTPEDWTVVDTSDRVEDLKKDIKYMSRLERAEYEAAKESVGMWADPMVRESRQDLVKEIEFEEEANIFQKVWRWFRG